MPICVQEVVKVGHRNVLCESTDHCFVCTDENSSGLDEGKAIIKQGHILRLLEYVLSLIKALSGIFDLGVVSNPGNEFFETERQLQVFLFCLPSPKPPPTDCRL